MNNFEHDEMEDIQPIKSTARAQAKAQPSVDDADESFEFGDQKYVSGSKLQRVKPEKGKVKRFAMVPGLKPLARETHYIDGKGTYACLGKDCPACAANNMARTRIVALAVEYVNADAVTGKFGKITPQYAVGYIQLSRPNYTQMISVLPEDATVYTVDWKLGYANRAFGYELSVMSNPCAYIKVGDQKVIEELVAEFLDNVDLKKKLGKRGSAMELKLALTGADDVDIAKLDDIDSIE